MSEGEVNQWASHLPALMGACAATSGPILECGVGYNSTLALHAFCAPSQRPILSLDGNQEWLERMRRLETPWHRFCHVEDWRFPPHPPWTGGWFSLAFVDHDCEPRGLVLPVLRNRTGIVVCHDSECAYTGYTEPLKLFDWAWTHKFSPAWTTVAGMGSMPEWVRELTPGEAGVPTPYRG